MSEKEHEDCWTGRVMGLPRRPPRVVIDEGSLTDTGDATILVEALALLREMADRGCDDPYELEGAFYDCLTDGYTDEELCWSCRARSFLDEHGLNEAPAG